jgi:UDP-N-acetylmuramate--alanine ligase
MYHFINIEEENMLGLALALKSIGYEVRGSGKKEKNIEGIEILKHNPDNIKGDLTVVYNNKDSIEYEKADFIKTRIYSYTELINKTIKLFSSIGVSGSGTKDITKYLISIFGDNYILNSSGNINKEQEFLTLEMFFDNDSFLNIETYYGIISNIDVSNHEEATAMLERYQEFGNNVDKMVLVCGDNSYARYLELNKPMFYYGLDDDNDIQAKDVEYSDNGTTFDLFVEGNFYGKFDLPVYNKADLLNVIAVLAICHYERIEAKEASNLLKEM